MLSSPGKVASRNPGLLSKLDLITARSSCSIHQRSGRGRSGDCFAVLPRAPPTPACYLKGHVPILGTATALAAVPGGTGRATCHSTKHLHKPSGRAPPPYFNSSTGTILLGLHKALRNYCPGTQKKVMPPSSEYFSRPSMGRRSRCDTPSLPSTAKRSPWM